MKPARLPKLDDDSSGVSITPGFGVSITSGFGATAIKSGKMSERLMWINVKIVNGSECASRYTYRGKTTFDDAQMICAGAEYGQTTCVGDSVTQ